MIYITKVHAVYKVGATSVFLGLHLKRTARRSPVFNSGEPLKVGDRAKEGALKARGKRLVTNSTYEEQQTT